LQNSLGILLVPSSKYWIKAVSGTLLRDEERDYDRIEILSQRTQWGVAHRI
jgi:hypothetical protein